MTATQVVLPPETPSSTERAQARFNELVALGKQAVQAERIWAQIGKLAVLMEQERDYAALGYESMGACILEIEVLSGYDRSSIYAYKSLWEKIEPNAGESGLQMRLGSAQLYWQLPAALQRDPEVQAAARAKPKVFREQIAGDYPQAIIETKTPLRLNLDSPVYSMWEEFLETCRRVSGNRALTYEQCFELYLLVPALEEIRNAGNGETQS